MAVHPATGQSRQKFILPDIYRSKQ